MGKGGFFEQNYEKLWENHGKMSFFRTELSMNSYSMGKLQENGCFSWDFMVFNASGVIEHGDNWKIPELNGGFQL